MSPPDAAPTTRQLTYLRALAARTATTFAYPATRAEASRQIDRLRGLRSEPKSAVMQIDRDEAQQLSYATAVHESEVSGFGSSAAWRVGSRPAGVPADHAASTSGARGHGHVRVGHDCGAPASAGDDRRLGAYPSPEGQRDLLTLTLANGETLVIDTLAGSIDDARLVARLGADEPPQNARLLSDLYLADETRGRCRPLTVEDLMPSSDVQSSNQGQDPRSLDTSLPGGDGRVFMIRELSDTAGLLELRWVQAESSDAGAPVEPVAVRNVVAALQDYEPARGLTVRALTARSDDPLPDTRRLAEELKRLAHSPIVLNRGLREAVERSVALGVSMSEIAMRCGRSKRDRSGGKSGETSWLARRVGQLPEGGQSEPTPWIHTDTLALIAREGLGISPNEVEL